MKTKGLGRHCTKCGITLRHGWICPKCWTPDWDSPHPIAELAGGSSNMRSDGEWNGVWDNISRLQER